MLKQLKQCNKQAIIGIMAIEGDQVAPVNGGERDQMLRET